MIYRKQKLRADDICNPYSDVVKNVANTIANDIDTIFEQALKPFGITRFNIAEYANRLKSYFAEDYKDGTRIFNQEIYLDNEHILTIIRKEHYPTFENGDVKILIETEIVKVKEI